MCELPRALSKKCRPPGNDSWRRASSRQPVIPPAPLTGDAGHCRGDAGGAPHPFVLPGQRSSRSSSWGRLSAEGGPGERPELGESRKFFEDSRLNEAALNARPDGVWDGCRRAADDRSKRNRRAPWGTRRRYLALKGVLRPPAWASGCANCAGRTRPGSRRLKPWPAGTASRSGMPAPAAHRSGTAPDRP